jgi:hypothetical protein
MREVIVILCVAIAVDADTTQAVPCGVVRTFEGPGRTIDVPEIVDTTGEDVS